MTKWKQFFDEKIREIAEGKVIFDIGGCSRFQKSLAPYRECFSQCEFKTVDIDPKCNPDIRASALELPIKNNFADGVICKSVLEHVEDPCRAVEEIYRIMKPGAKCFVYVPFLHSYHGSDRGKDYWRFSEDGIKHLFKKFNRIEICPVKGHFETIALLLPFQDRFPVNMLVYLMRLLDVIFNAKQSKKQVCGYSIFLVK